MAKNSTATATETATNNIVDVLYDVFVVQDGPCPQAIGSSRASTGMAKKLKELKIGGWFAFDRVDNGKGGLKRDNSKAANINAIARKHKVGVEIRKVSEAQDVVVRLS